MLCVCLLILHKIKRKINTEKRHIKVKKEYQLSKSLESNVIPIFLFNNYLLTK